MHAEAKIYLIFLNKMGTCSSWNLHINNMHISHISSDRDGRVHHSTTLLNKTTSQRIFQCILWSKTNTTGAELLMASSCHQIANCTPSNENTAQNNSLDTRYYKWYWLGVNPVFWVHKSIQCTGMVIVCTANTKYICIMDMIIYIYTNTI